MLIIGFEHYISMDDDSIESHLNHHYKHIFENDIITFKLLIPLQDVLMCFHFGFQIIKTIQWNSLPADLLLS